MAGLEVRATCKVEVRDNFGRFLSRLHAAEQQAIRETKEEGVMLARAFAPKKTGAMAASITGTQGTSGCTWSVGTDHWHYTELGARRHTIPGHVRFFWVKAGRMWTPGQNIIDHPGTRAVHYMRRSYMMTAPKLLMRIKRNMG